MTTVHKAPADLAATLKKLGLTSSDLSSAKHAAKAVLETGGGDKTAKLVRHLDDDALSAVRALLGEEKGVVTLVGGTGGAVRKDLLHQKLPMTTSPDAARALALYRPNATSVGRAFERFLIHAGRLQLELEHNADKMLDDPKVAERVRKHLFMLQGLVRLYDGRGPDKKMDKALTRIKELEDAIGAFGHACDMRAAAAGAKQVPPEATAHLEREVGKARKDLAALVEEWRPGQGGRSERLDDLVDTAAKIDFGSAKDDVKFVRKALADVCRSIADKHLDMGDLEGGVHELRRQLRWLPITMIALEGLITLDVEGKGPIPAFERLKHDPVAQSPFARLPVTDADRAHVEIPWTLFLALSKAIGDLGKIKDGGQQIEGLAEALLHGGSSKGAAQAVAERVLGNEGGARAVHGDAARLYQELQASGLLEALAKAFAG
ncbi:MAG: hypothetical protein A2138_24675 [Deltaproteobacteria bacterium RBG_16_71_12]|nr:MAG: hypothetical protein A2138_24675 [Deltaproteobacteria bacterium RBG_16_71_12]